MAEAGALPLVIFDCDGVLVDSEAIACRVDAACLTEAGFPTTPEEIAERYIGRAGRFMLDDIERRHGRPLPEGLAAELRRRLMAAFAAELTAVPGMRGLLQGLRAPVCVASSSDPERVRESLRLAGLLDLVAPHLFSATEVARGKPAPDLFLHAAAAMGHAPPACAVVEDSAPGIEAARAAGMTAIGFTGGSHCRPGDGDTLTGAGAHVVAADAGALAAALAAYA